MKNTHLEHPEDVILTGDLSIFDWMLAGGNLSVKIDGCPAIVWGTNPATGNFFVGTKSVFNKKLIKINESHADIDANHSGVVADLLHHCFDCLPDDDGIIQGDFIGYGGDDTFRPNTITYVFDEVIDQNIIIAPHTCYYAKSDLRDAVAYPLDYALDDTEYCKFVQPDAWQIDEDFDEIVQFARQMSTLCEFVTPSKASKIKKVVNACIRDQMPIHDELIADELDFDVNVLRLWKLVKSIKEDMLYLCRNDGPQAYINDEESNGEGYVMSNQFGMFKLVNREGFSYANFNYGKFSCAS